MSGFDAGWLGLREPVDALARDPGLADRLARWLTGSGRRPIRIVDLAAGTGANFRALAPRLAVDQHWLLVDHDDGLIAAQADAIRRWAKDRGLPWRDEDEGLSILAPDGRWRVQARCLDLSQRLESIDLDAFDAVTTTAFLDLVSDAWLARLGHWLAAAGLPLLATLTVDGRRSWSPALPADRLLLDAFLGHQAGDKGFGAALGERAAPALAARLATLGFDIESATSDWRLGREHPAMLSRLIDEAVAVVSPRQAAGAVAAREWQVIRHRQAQQGLLGLQVGHLDLLAIPASPRSP